MLQETRFGMQTQSRLLAADESDQPRQSTQDVSIDPAIARAKRQRRWIILAGGSTVLVLTGVWLVSSWLSTTIIMPRDRVRIAEVTRGHFVSDIAAQGTAVAAVSPMLYAPAAGTVSLRAKAGDAVTQNQVLATLDSPLLINEFARERATLDSLDVALQHQAIEMRRQRLQDQQTTDLANVEMKAAEREFRRMEEAFAKGSIPRRDVDRAKDTLEETNLKYQHALQNAQMQGESLDSDLETKRIERERQKLVVAGLQRRVNDLSIRSPLNGMIGNLVVNDRTAVSESAALLTVVDLSVLDVEFRVPESYGDSLAISMAAKITFDGKVYDASVVSISPEVKDNEVSGHARFTENAPPSLRQNQRLNLAIILDSRDGVLKVERGAFANAGDSAYVIKDDLAVRRRILIGASSAGEVEILGGLTVGDRIIVSDTTEFKNVPVVRLVN
jgi:HlyD family secretion protein